MTLQQIVDKNGYNVVVRRIAGQSEPIRLLRENNEKSYWVEGQLSGYTYTELSDLDSFEIVPTKQQEMEKWVVNS